MTTKWLVRWGCMVKKEIERETAKCYWIDGYRVNKERACSKWFDSEEEAKAELVRQAKWKIERAKDTIRKAEAQIAKYS